VRTEISHRDRMAALQLPRRPAPGSSRAVQRDSTARPGVLPGLLAVAAATTTASIVHAAVPQISTLIVAVLIGAVIGNGQPSVDVLRPGLAAAARRLLRIGVVLLGLRLSIEQVTSLGFATVSLVVVTVATTFVATRWLGSRLGLSPALSLLVATGYSICGASAIAAMEGTSDADEDEVALAIGLVTLAGTAAMFSLPTLASVLGLSDHQFGLWVGASVHDVAQVVAAASTGGSAVLAIAIVVKLTRVVMLAPLVAGVSIARKRRVNGDPNHGPAATAPLLPLFVLGFLSLMAARSTGAVPDAVISLANTLANLSLTAALVGLGAGVRFDRLRNLGLRPLALGGLAWVVVASVSLIGALIVG
jgi:uncharacterized integral membrane protein (TIGR00698 family)